MGPTGGGGGGGPPLGRWHLQKDTPGPQRHPCPHTSLRAHPIYPPSPIPRPPRILLVGPPPPGEDHSRMERTEAGKQERPIARAAKTGIQCTLTASLRSHFCSRLHAVWPGPQTELNFELRAAAQQCRSTPMTTVAPKWTWTRSTHSQTLGPQPKQIKHASSHFTTQRERTTRETFASGWPRRRNSKATH